MIQVQKFLYSTYRYFVFIVSFFFYPLDYYYLFQLRFYSRYEKNRLN